MYLPFGGVQSNPLLQVFTDNPPAKLWPTTPVFAGHLPEEYDPRQPGNGLAVVVRVGGSGVTDGGVAHTEMPIIDPRMQITVWAGNNLFELARKMDGAIFDWIHAKSSLDFGDMGFVLSSLNQVLGQDITDPSGLATVVSWYHLTLREN
jgi:hypothetical protein